MNFNFKRSKNNAKGYFGRPFQMNCRRDQETGCASMVVSHESAIKRITKKRKQQQPYMN